MCERYGVASRHAGAVYSGQQVAAISKLVYFDMCKTFHTLMCPFSLPVVAVVHSMVGFDSPSCGVSHFNDRLLYF